MTPFLHYSVDPLGTLRECPQVPGMKPTGLWLSVGDAWRAWCEAEAFGPEPRFVTRVELADDAKILRLTPADLDFFTDRYGVGDERSGYDFCIDWFEVAVEYDGVVLSPYDSARRYAQRSGWTYGWDVPSACIWHPRAIALWTTAPFPYEETQ